MSNNSSFLTIKLWDKSILPSSNILSDEGVSLWIFRYILPHLIKETIMALHHFFKLTNIMHSCTIRLIRMFFFIIINIYPIYYVDMTIVNKHNRINVEFDNYFTSSTFILSKIVGESSTYFHPKRDKPFVYQM